MARFAENFRRILSLHLPTLILCLGLQRTVLPWDLEI